MNDHHNPSQTGPSPLQAALDEEQRPVGSLGDALGRLGEYELSSTADAQALVLAIRDWSKTAAQGIDLILPLHLFTGLLQGVQTAEAFEVLKRNAMPGLLDAFDKGLQAEPVEGVETLLFLLKVAGMYGVEEVVERIAAASRRGLGESSALWPTILATFNDDHPFQLRLVQRLKEPLPTGLLALSYLHLAGQLMANHRLTFHPFDHAEGRVRLRAWLLDVDNEASAVVVAANLPYLEPSEDRSGLLHLARTHPKGGVRLKAHWAEAKLGDPQGVQKLVELCKSPGRAKPAVAALESLGKAAFIPSASQQPNFQAAAELCDWLAHPNEHGRPPDAIELIDTRTALWPPTDDRRRLWLFRFRYETAGKVFVGKGMVGSITFSLRDETKAVDDPIDLYALHCLWERQVESDPRQLRSRTAEEGRAVLKSAGWDL